MRSIAQQRARELQKLREERARGQSGIAQSNRGGASSRNESGRSITGRRPYVTFTPSNDSDRQRDRGPSRRPKLDGSRPSSGSSAAPALSREAAKAQSKAPVVLYTPPKPKTGVEAHKTERPRLGRGGGLSSGGNGNDGSPGGSFGSSSSGSSRPSAALSRTDAGARPSVNSKRPQSGSLPGLGSSNGGAGGFDSAPSAGSSRGAFSGGAKNGASTPGRPLGGNRTNDGALSASRGGNPFVSSRGETGRPHRGDSVDDGPSNLVGFGDPPPAVAHDRARPFDPGRARHDRGQEDDDWRDGDWRDGRHGDRHHGRRHHDHHHRSYCSPYWDWSWSSLWCGNSYWDTRWYWWNRAHPSWHPYCSSGWDGWRFSFGFSYSSSSWGIGVGVHYGDLWYDAPHQYHWYRCRPWLAYDPCYSTCSVRYYYPTYRPWRHTTVTYGAPVYERVIYRDVVYEDSYHDDWYSADDSSAGGDWYDDGSVDESDWVSTYDTYYGGSGSAQASPTVERSIVVSAGLDAAWTNLAAGDVELARGQFESLVLTRPELSGARVGYGLALGLGGRLPECASALRIAMMESPEGFAETPMSPAMNDRIRQLAEHAAEAVRIDPRDTDALFVVATTRMLIGDNAVAYFAIDAAYRSGDVRESTLRLREHLNAVMYDEF